VGVVGPGIGVMGKPDHPASYGQYLTFPQLGGKWWSKQQDTPYPVPSLGGGFMVMRHDTLKQAGAFDAGMPEWGSEDLELCIRYWLLGHEVWVVPEVTVLHYFRQTNPNRARWQVVSHNLLRVALLHFSHERLAQVISALKTDAKFGDALALAADSDVWQKRADLAAHRVRDDEWLFETFKVSCPVVAA
jgi:GT2 family glycosyltransferase